MVYVFLTILIHVTASKDGLEVNVNKVFLLVIVSMKKGINKLYIGE